MTYHAKMSPLKKIAIGAVAIAAAWGYGSCRYNAGFTEGRTPITTQESFAEHETAPGFLNFPGTFTIRNQLNSNEQNESYLRNKETGQEVPLSDSTWRYLDAYQDHSRSLDLAVDIAEKLP
jgi:hypothetical protein